MYLKRCGICPLRGADQKLLLETFSMYLFHDRGFQAFITYYTVYFTINLLRLAFRSMESRQEYNILFYRRASSTNHMFRSPISVDYINFFEIKQNFSLFAI